MDAVDYSACVLTHQVARIAENHLSDSDKVMAHLIQSFGPSQIVQRAFEPFQTLVNSIIGQQLSSKAADSIKGRVRQYAPGFTPEEFLEVSADQLREAGLSRAKLLYIREVAKRVIDGRLNFSSLQKKSDESVIEELVELRGIGPWTAEMFLIFGLKRANVLSIGDAGLRRAVRALYGESAKLEDFEELWQPYCSVASWYLWRFLD